MIWIASREKGKIMETLILQTISEDYSNYNGNELNKNFTNYKADILYITFLLFEGNILEQMKCN